MKEKSFLCGEKRRRKMLQYLVDYFHSRKWASRRKSPVLTHLKDD